jgi:hypothetical protein
MVGNLLAVSLSFVLEDALHELVSAQSDPSFSDILQAEEDADFRKFTSAALPRQSRGVGLPPDIDRELFFRGQSFCHTARLPAEIRHLGILTESSLVGEDSYDKGQNKAALQSKMNGSMPLVYESGERQKCKIPLNKDYKDYFLLRKSFGWSQLTLPNDAEMKAYGTGAPLHGIVAICFRDGGGMDLGMMEMEVNGIQVSFLTRIRKTCMFLKNEGGHIWKPNSDGRFEIRAKGKVNATKSDVRFSNFVIW